jgi:dimethylargininase
MLIAFTRIPSPRLQDCKLTHLHRQPIDAAKALEQHCAYETTLRSLCAQVVRLPEAPELPDAVFVEDVAVVLDEVTILASMAAPSRRAEPDTARQPLAEYRKVVPLKAPATLDGGDVLRIGRQIFVGLSARTNSDAVDAMTRILRPYDYAVLGVPVSGCLHLKTGCTYVGNNTLLINREWIDPRAFADVTCIDVPKDEPTGANALMIQNTTLLSASAPHTAKKLATRGFKVVTVDISEFEKAEGGLTCMSILLEASKVPGSVSSGPPTRRHRQTSPLARR